MLIRNSVSRRIVLAAAISMCGLSHQSQALPISGDLNFRTVSVYPTLLVGPVAPDPGIVSDFQYISQIYGQIGIRTFDLADTTLRADSGGANAGTWTSAQVATGATALLNNNNNANNAINIYYVPSYPSAFGQAWSAEDVPGNAVAVGAVMNQNLAGGGRRVDTVPHEVGHVLVDTWRWKSTERSAADGFHSNNANDLMAAGGAFRNIPANLNQAAPVGNFSKLGNNVGPTSGNANAIMPFIQSLYSNNTFTGNIQRDQVSVKVGQFNAATTSSGNFGWGLTQNVNDAANTGKNWKIDEVAQAINNQQEVITVIYDAATAFGAGGYQMRFGIDDINSLGLKNMGLIGTPTVTVYSNILTDAGKTVLTQNTAGANADYFWSGVYDNPTGAQSIQIDISNAAALGNVKDIALTFSLQVPEPTTLSLLGLTAIGLLRRNRRRMS